MAWKDLAPLFTILGFLTAMWWQIDGKIGDEITTVQNKIETVSERLARLEGQIEGSNTQLAERLEDFSDRIANLSNRSHFHPVTLPHAPGEDLSPEALQGFQTLYPELLSESYLKSLLEAAQQRPDRPFFPGLPLPAD